LSHYGSQKTLPLSPKQVWEILMNKEGMSYWLGNISSLKMTKGEKYRTKEGVEDEIRTFTAGRNIRFTWKPKNRKKPVAIQIYVLPTSGERSSIRFHQERLESKEEREKMRRYWQKVPNAISRLKSLK